MPVFEKHVLVLHGAVRQVWHEVFGALTETGWVVHNCDSELLLVSQLGQITGRFVICIGAVESLPARPEPLLTWLTDNGVNCCFWATRRSSWDLIEQVQSFGIPVFTRKEAFNTWIRYLEDMIPEHAVGAQEGDPTVSDEELAALFGEEDA